MQQNTDDQMLAKQRALEAIKAQAMQQQGQPLQPAPLDMAQPSPDQLAQNEPSARPDVDDAISRFLAQQQPQQPSPSPMPVEAPQQPENDPSHVMQSDPSNLNNALKRKREQDIMKNLFPSGK